MSTNSPDSPTNPPKTVTMMARVPYHESETIREIAAMEQRSLSNVMQRLVLKGLAAEQAAGQQASAA